MKRGNMERIYDTVIRSIRAFKPYFMVGNRHIGCGHRHRTAQAARNCFKRHGLSAGQYRIYRVATRPDITALDRV